MSVEIDTDYSEDLSTQRLENVITGVGTAGLDNERSVFEVRSGLVAALDFHLDDSLNGLQTAWDARILNYGADMAEPQRAFLDNAATSLRWSVQNSDCDVFGSNGWCISADVIQTQRNSSGQANDENNSAGSFTLAKQLDQGYRIGLFVSNAHGFGDVSGVTVTSQQPTYGGFIGYSQNADGTGLQARISAAYQTGTGTFQRSNVLGSATNTSASAGFETGALSATVGKGYKVEGDAVVTPYLGLTMSSATRVGYSESSQQAGVLDAQFSYDAYRAVQVTGSLGFTVDGQIGDKVTYHFGASVERDLSYSLSEFTIRGDFGNSSYQSGESPRNNRVNVSAGLGFLVGENSTVTLGTSIVQHSGASTVDYKLVAGYRMKF
jgi:hypothetical protein